jgi:hypothetical protein
MRWLGGRGPGSCAKHEKVSAAASRDATAKRAKLSGNFGVTDKSDLAFERFTT